MIELVIDKPGFPPVTYRLRGGVYGLGRHEDNEIVLDDREVSRMHARLLVDGDVVVIEDLGSGNGTFVEGSAVADAPLGSGDVVDIVPFRLHVRAADEADEVADAWLEGVDGPARGIKVTLEGDRLTIGRADDQDLVLHDAGASRSHAHVHRRGNGWAISDNGSANGLLINGQQLAEATLRTGDLVRIGTSTLRFVEGSEGWRDDAGLELEEATVEASALAQLGAHVDLTLEAPEVPMGPPAAAPEEDYGDVVLVVAVGLVVGVVLLLMFLIVLARLGYVG